MLDDEDVLAIVLSRVAGFFIPHQYAEKLVLSHMAITKHISTSSSNSIITAMYLSEPSLAAGSMVLSWRLGGFGSVAMLCRLRKVFSSSPFHPGDVGEIAVIIVFLKAMDKCSLKETHSDLQA
eukprot:1867072-Rhodomonas_salina.1